MSDLFLKNSVKNNNFLNSTESSLNLKKILNIDNVSKVNNSVTSTAIMQTINELSSTSYNNTHVGGASVTSTAIMQTINELSSTSYNNTQVGGASITSSANLSKINSNDINNLLSMLTSESNAQTVTEDLENKLKNLLTQDGGNYESTEMLENKLVNLLSQNGGTSTDDMDTETLESKIKNIQTGGTAKAILGLAGLAATGALFSEFDSKTVIDKIKPVFKSTSDTSSEMPRKTIFKKSQKNNRVLATTTEIPSSSTSSAMPDKRLYELEGGDNPGLEAFREISKLVSEELKISNGSNCKKIAGQLHRDVKEEMPDITHDKLVDAARKHLKANINTYRKMIEAKKK
jgi:Fe-S cluster biogenesis protein NfuA